MEHQQKILNQNDYLAIIELNIKVEATLTDEIYIKKVNTHTYNFIA